MQCLLRNSDDNDDDNDGDDGNDDGVDDDDGDDDNYDDTVDDDYDNDNYDDDDEDDHAHDSDTRKRTSTLLKDPSSYFPSISLIIFNPNKQYIINEDISYHFNCHNIHQKSV